jgi:pyridinium-3,5-bisthiocarboxylic acid mononucleotide nickel chelatase
MKIAFFDCFAGASGDMILGALLDAGLEIETLKTELAKLGLSGYDVQVKKVVKRGIGGSQAIVIIDPPSQHNDHKTDLFGRHEHHHHHGNHYDSDPHHVHSHEHQGHTHHDHNHNHHVHSHHGHEKEHTQGHHTDQDRPHKDNFHHRNLHDIRNIIENSRLNRSVKEKSIKIFTRLAEAEAKVHRTSIEQIHFHEVGAMDAILDVVGGVIGIEALGIEAIYCSPLHVGSGTVKCAHGTLPVPAPATLELIREKPIFSTGVTGELLTPTGAAILTTLASGFGPMPEMMVESIGYGSGEKDPPIPNLLRVSIGESNIAVKGYQTERVGVVETNIDDMNPQIYDYLIEKLLDMGVLDTFLVPVQMKKNRPGTLITVLCSPEMVGKVADFLIRETTSIGLRYRIDQRIKAHRRIEKVETPFGPIHCKVASLDGGEILNVFPEYEDCKRVALENGMPLKKVMEKVIATTSKNEAFKVA